MIVSCSTPARPTDPPSLHEEISRHGNLSGPSLLSPLVGIDNRHGNKESCRLEDHYDNSEPSLSRSHGNLTLEDLDHIAQNSVSVVPFGAYLTWFMILLLSEQQVSL